MHDVGLGDAVVIARTIQQALPVLGVTILKTGSVVQHIVAKQPLSGPQTMSENIPRFAFQHPLQELNRGAGCGILTPLDANRWFIGATSGFIAWQHR